MTNKGTVVPYMIMMKGEQHESKRKYRESEREVLLFFFDILSFPRYVIPQINIDGGARRKKRKRYKSSAATHYIRSGTVYSARYLGSGEDIKTEDCTRGSSPTSLSLRIYRKT